MENTPLSDYVTTWADINMVACEAVSCSGKCAGQRAWRVLGGPVLRFSARSLRASAVDVRFQGNP
jgi:hypothetical protein